MEPIQFVCAFLSFQSTPPPHHHHHHPTPPSPPPPQNPPNKRLLVCQEFSTFFATTDIFPLGKFPLITGFSWTLIGAIHNSGGASAGGWGCGGVLRGEKGWVHSGQGGRRATSLEEIVKVFQEDHEASAARLQIPALAPGWPGSSSLSCRWFLGAVSLALFSSVLFSGVEL